MDLKREIEKRQVTLKPCPFCGGKAKIDTYRIIGDNHELMVFCTECAIRTQLMLNLDDVVAKWNSRARESELIETACGLIECGAVSVGRGADIAGIPYYRMEDELRKRKIKWKE